MNKALLAWAGAGLLVSGSAAAEIVVYGKANLTLNNSETKTVAGTSQDNWELNSNASRVGVKGSQVINDNLKAIFKAEYEVFIDDGDDGSGDSSEFKQRNIYGGLQGNWGTVIAGNFDTPLKLVGKRVDQFNDLPLGDIKNVMAGEERVKNSIQYTSPKFSGVRVSVDLMPGEGSGEDGATGSDKDNGVADYRSIAIEWERDGIYLAAAQDQEVDSDNVTRYVAQYSADRFVIGALVQNAEAEGRTTLKNDPSGASNIAEQDAQLVSAAYKVGNGVKLKAQWAKSENESTVAGTPDFEVTQTAVGVEKKLAKKVKVFGYYSTVDSEQGSAVDTEDKTLAIGLEAKF